MSEWEQTLFNIVLPLSIGVAVTYLVGKNTNNFIKIILNPMQATVDKMAKGIQPLESEIKLLRESVDSLTTCFREIPDILKAIIQELKSVK